MWNSLTAIGEVKEMENERYNEEEFSPGSGEKTPKKKVNWKLVIFGKGKPNIEDKIKLSLRVCKWYLLLVTTLAFASFLLEESMQTRGFGRYSLIQGKMWAEAAQMCNESADMLKGEKKFMKLNSFVNPFFGWVYYRYAQAEEMKLWAEMKRIEKELAGLGSRLEVVENKLEVKPIALIPETKGGEAIPSLEKQEIRPVKQIDYETHGERVEKAIQAKVSGYVGTEFGKKYHRPGCASISGKAVHDLTKEEIDSKGLEPCLRCRPDLQKGN